MDRTDLERLLVTLTAAAAIADVEQDFALAKAALAFVSKTEERYQKLMLLAARRAGKSGTIRDLIKEMRRVADDRFWADNPICDVGY